MSAAIGLRGDYDARALRAAAKRSKDGPQARRLLVLAAIYDGATFTTWFFPVGDDIRKIVAHWVAFLLEEKGFGPDDPLFPKTKVAPGDDLAFRAVSLDRAPWANANPVRDIFREACARAGLPYFNPHLLRNTLVQVPTIEGSTQKSLRLGHRTSGMKAV
jgi:hypothetical protein